MVESSYRWTGCPSTISPMTSPNFVNMTTGSTPTLDCFRNCQFYGLAYIKVTSSGFQCYCSPSSGADGTTASGYGQCKVSTDSAPAYFAYSHEPGTAAAVISGYYRRRLKETMKEEQERQKRNADPYCPGALKACLLTGHEDSFEVSVVRLVQPWRGLTASVSIPRMS
jgi:hypothetical protein